MKIVLQGWGDIEKNLTEHLREIAQANKTALMQIGLAAEKDAKATIRDQSENWAKLSPKYLAYKTAKTKNRKRYSEKILIRTSSYFLSITSFVKEDKAYIGVPINAKNSETGKSIAEYARVLEYGSPSKNIPPRPFLSVVLERAKRNASKIMDNFLNKVHTGKRGGKFKYNSSGRRVYQKNRK